MSQQPKPSTYALDNVDTSYVRRQRRKVHHGHEEGGGELNIVPYLDIVVNLIMFLLVGQAMYVSLAVIDITAPTYASMAPGEGGDEQQKNSLKLTVGIADEGFYIAATGGVLPGEQAEPENPELTPDNVAKRPPTIPKKPDGAYDYAGLSAKLRSIKTVFPDSSQLFVAADATTPYEVLVRTLDASRADKTGALFPVVAFSKIN
jgi:biopolymer transport protein TolR